MYKCNECGNTKDFKEINTIETYLINDKQVEDKFLQRDDVICCECDSKYSDGMIVEITSTFPPLHTNILTEITSVCAHECGNSNSCSEEECVLYRIERLILEEVDK